ncbi:MAG: protein TolR [Bdellovibrionota bacterium]|jgi:biopolymer transport protein TolR
MAGSKHNSQSGPVANINVTPLVDVMLVLLVIFMVTAPMLQQGVDVNLPKATTAALQGTDEQVVVSIDVAGDVYIGSGNKIELSAISEKINAILKARPAAERKVYIKADTDLQYGRVMEVMGELHQGGVTQIGLVSAPVSSAKRSEKDDKKGVNTKK